jgi:hypothetical protein
VTKNGSQQEIPSIFVPYILISQEYPVQERNALDVDGMMIKKITKRLNLQ